MWYLLLFAIVDVASASLTPKLYTKVFDGQCTGSEVNLGIKTLDECNTDCMAKGFHSFVMKPGSGQTCYCERGNAWGAFDWGSMTGHHYGQKDVSYRCGDGVRDVQLSATLSVTQDYGDKFVAGTYLKYQAYCPAGKYHYSMTHCAQCPVGKYRPDEWRVTDGACDRTSCMLITESGANAYGTGVCTGECDGGSHPYGSSTTLQCSFYHDNSATIHCFQKGEATTASQAPIPGCAHVGENIGWDYCYDTALPEGNFDAHQCHDCPYGYGPSADQKSCVVLPVPGYTYVRQGLCVNGLPARAYNLGIRTYEGDGDNSGTDKLDVCAKSCKYQKEPLAYGPWYDDDPATGFGMYSTGISSTGRCYCNHLKHGDLSTCSVDHTVYNMYRFDVEAGCSPGQESDGSSCTDCVAGKYSSDGGACASCPTGFKSKDDHTACETCPGGYEPSSDKSSCDTCEAGKVSSDGGACETCPSGYSQDQTGQSECTTVQATFGVEFGVYELGSGYCEPATGSDIRFASTTFEQCGTKCNQEPDCNMFAWHHSDACMLSLQGASDTCLTQKENTGGDYNWMRYKIVCLDGFGGDECQECVAGKYSSDGTACASCPTGFKSKDDHTACETCPGGYEPSSDRSSCDTCAAGQFSSDGADCASCPTGFKSKDDHTACETCPGGSIISSDQSSCETCDTGKVSNADGTDCQCKDGYGGSPCVICEAGQFSSGGADCALCGEGYQDQAGQPDCNVCDDGYVNDEKTTCTLCPLNIIPESYTDWSSGCPEWSTDDGCFCNCTGSGFTGEHCDICAKGMGWNGVLGADAKCVACTFPTVNDQTSHSAVCSHDFCPPGSGTTSDEAAWLADNSTVYENCVACAGNTVSPSYYGQCTEVMCNAYSTVKDTIDHELNNTNQTNCEPCSGYNVGASCSPIVCESGRMKRDHDGSAAGDSYIDYSLEPDNQINCIPCGLDEVVSADGTSCVKIVCPAGFKILVVDPTLSYNDQKNCEECTGFTYAKGTECIDFDCAPYRVKEIFDRIEDASKCGEQCAGDTILDVNDLTQCVACEGDTVVNIDHTECVTSVCRVGYVVSVTDRSLTPDDYHQDANCEEIDECLTASCSSCGDVVNGYVCTEEIELRQGIEAFANANEDICPSGFRLSSKPPVNAADIGLRNGACPPLKVFAEQFSIHEGVFRSKLVENTASVDVEGKACKYTYEDLISL